MNAKDFNVYITGADGFIGSHLTEKLLELGCKVTALCVYNSNGSYGWLNKFAHTKPANLNLLLGDVRDSSFLQTTVPGHDTVFHLASLIAIPYSYLAPQSYIDTNVSGTLNVAMASKNANCRRVVHTSTSEVYGSALYVPIDEKHPLQGQSPYSASKIGADKIIESFVKSFQLPAVTLRPFNTFGPRQSLRAVLPTIVAQILAGAKRIELGSLTPTRDFNFVSDTVDAFIAVGLNTDESLVGETFNTGTGSEISVGDVAHLIADILGKNVEIVSKDVRIRPKDSEVERLLSNFTKLKSATGWQPKVSLREGLIKMVDWMKSEGDVNKIDTSKYHV